MSSVPWYVPIIGQLNVNPEVKSKLDSLYSSHEEFIAAIVSFVEYDIDQSITDIHGSDPSLKEMTKPVIELLSSSIKQRFQSASQFNPPSFTTPSSQYPPLATISPTQPTTFTQISDLKGDEPETPPFQTPYQPVPQPTQNIQFQAAFQQPIPRQLVQNDLSQPPPSHAPHVYASPIVYPPQPPPNPPSNPQILSSTMSTTPTHLHLTSNPPSHGYQMNPPLDTTRMNLPMTSIHHVPLQDQQFGVSQIAQPPFSHPQIPHPPFNQPIHPQPQPQHLSSYLPPPMHPHPPEPYHETISQPQPQIHPPYPQEYPINNAQPPHSTLP
ncbi:hypothetical protein BLNAU_7764 [Blattamonas nauphoetae]|uniref:Uncharacterized protein n=1 Tax=Blattamonas nauphoetae TaxID=2049346 RepID=A0ABQ9Y094_9EUKA|nr:hypothetical protein BLNAU_7764 [Blattamonas nauphoetae]